MKKYISAIIIQIFLVLVLFSCNNRENLLKAGGLIKSKVDIEILTSMPIEVGDPIDIVLSIRTTKNSKVDYPKKTEYFNPFFLKGYKVKENIKGNKKGVDIYYTLISLYSGKIVLQPLSIRIGNKIIKTVPLKINVLSTIPDKKTMDINDITRPLRNNWLIIVLFPIIILSFIITFLYRKKFGFFYRKKRINVKYNKKAVTYDPILISIISIYKLNTDVESTIKDKYYNLSANLKKILGEVFGLNLMPFTTNKIKSIVNKKISDEFYRYLVRKLYMYDEIKYSKKTLNSEYKSRLINNFKNETQDLLRFLFLFLLNHYKKMIEFMV